MFASFSMPSKESIKSAAKVTGKFVVFVVGAAAGAYVGTKLVKHYGSAAVDTVSDQVVGG